MNGKSWILAGLGIILLILFLVMPPIEPLTPTGMKVIGVFLFTATWWIAYDIGFPSLLCIALMVVTGLMKPNDVIAVSWGNYMNIFVIGVCGIAESLRATGYSERFALWFLSRPFTAGRPWVLLGTFFLSVTLMGAFMETTAVCVIFMAIAEPMLLALGYKKGDTFAATVMMGIGWVSISAMVMTPIGHGVNLVLIDWVKRDMGYNLTFARWFAIGFPSGLLYSLLVFAYLRLIVRPDVSRFGREAFEYIRKQKSKMGAMKLEEKLALAILLMVVVCWLFPDLGKNLFPAASAYVSGLGYAVPPLIAAGLLCVIKIKRQPLLTFQHWMQSVPWGTIALISGIQAIRGPLEDPATGIPQLLNNLFSPLASGLPLLVYIMIGLFWTITQTQFMSNFVTVTLVYTAMMPAALALKLGNPVALAFCFWYGARAAFALPSATSTTALAVGSGWVPIGFMAKWGFPLIIPMVLFFTFIIYPLGLLIFR